MAVKDGLPATDFSRMNREYIKAKIEEAGGGSGGGGAGLPPVTEADNGKILGVVNGAWGAMDAGGGGGVDGITGATVTFHIQNPQKYMWGGECVAIQNGALYGRVGQLGEDIDTVVTALLYNGEGTFTPDSVKVVSVTGDAKIEYGTVHISGDCTINIDGNYPD